MLSRQWPNSDAFNAALLTTIGKKRSVSKGVTRSLHGGWHSKVDLFEWGTPEVAELAQRVFSCFQEVTRVCATQAGTLNGAISMCGWANVTERGGYNRVHNHPDSSWSGVYYVATGASDPDAPTSGVLEFLDPRPAAGFVATPGRPFGANVQIAPVAGLMVLFPSWLFHFVNPFEGTGERVSISFNVSLS